MTQPPELPPPRAPASSAQSGAESKLVLSERTGDIVILRFNDPDRRNAMTRAMGEAFREQVERCARDESLRAVVLTGAGPAFSAGGDLAMIAERSREGRARPGIARWSIRDTMRAFYELFLSIRQLPCPTLAAINGHAIGAGMCVALACDLRFAAAEAKLGLNFARLGIHPGMGASWTLPRLVGPARAAELLYTGRLLSSAEAVEIGLVNRAFPAGRVLAETRAVASDIAGCGPLAVRGVKRALARSLDASLPDQLDFEASEQAVCFESDDVAEGLAAAKEHRNPVFLDH